MTEYQGSAGENKTLAGLIRGFVAAMPAIETERQQIKRELAGKFTKHADKGLAPAAGQGQKNGAEQSAPRGGDKDVQR